MNLVTYSGIQTRNSLAFVCSIHACVVRLKCLFVCHPNRYVCRHSCVFSSTIHRRPQVGNGEANAGHRTKLQALVYDILPLEEGAGKRCSECDQYPNLSEGADRVGGQLHGEKECPFSSVTKSGRVWRKVPESDARSVAWNLTNVGCSNMP